MTIDTVLLEFDGVLADTSLARRDAMYSVLEEDGIALSTEEYVDACLGRTTGEAVRAVVAGHGLAMDQTGLDLLTMRVDRAFSAHVATGVVLVEGARESVQRLSARVRLGVVSRISRRDVEFVLSLADLEDEFVCIVGAEDAYPAKPSPAPYLAAMRRIEGRRPVSARGVVVALEDSIAGIRSARAAQLRCIAVGNLPAHVAMEAEAIIPSVAGIDVASLEQLVTHAGENFA